MTHIHPIRLIGLISLILIGLMVLPVASYGQFTTYQECLDSGQTPSECAYLNQQGSQSGFNRAPSTGDFSLPRTTQAGSIEELLNGVAAFLLTIAIPIATIMIIVGAFQILTSAGNPEKVTTGKKTIIYAAVGIAIIALFRVLIALIAQLLGADI